MKNAALPLRNEMMDEVGLGIDASDAEEVDPEELAAILEEDGGSDDDALAAQG